MSNGVYVCLARNLVLILDMKLFKLILLLLATQASNFLFAQEILSSSTYIKTCIQKTECSSIGNSSIMFYDQSKASLYLRLDFNKFRFGQDSVDYWLDDLSATFLYFKIDFPQENFAGLIKHQLKTFKLNGQIYLNGIWQNQTIEVTVFCSDNSVFSSTNSGQNPYENYKLNMSFNILPKDFNIHKKPHHLKKVIFVGVALGRINLLQPDQQHLLGEAYNHH